MGTNTEIVLKRTRTKKVPKIAIHVKNAEGMCRKYSRANFPAIS